MEGGEMGIVERMQKTEVLGERKPERMKGPNCGEFAERKSGVVSNGKNYQKAAS